MKNVIKEFFSGGNLARFAGPTVALTGILYLGYSLISPPETVDEKRFERERQTELRASRLKKIRAKRKRQSEYKKTALRQDYGLDENNERDYDKDGVGALDKKKLGALNGKKKAAAISRPTLAQNNRGSGGSRNSGLSANRAGGGGVSTGGGGTFGGVTTSGDDGGGADDFTVSGDDSGDSDGSDDNNQDDSGDDNNQDGDSGEGTSGDTGSGDSSSSSTSGGGGATGAPVPITSTTSTSTGDDTSTGDTSGTSGSTDTGGGPPVLPPSGGDQTKPVVTADIGGGAFKTPPFPKLSSNEFGPIYYCVKTAADCFSTSRCDVKGADQTLYVPGSFITVGAGDGTHCLEYYAQDLAGNVSDIQLEVYIADTNLPDMDVIQPKTQVQTNELLGAKSVDSTTFGVAAGGTHFLSEVVVDGKQTAKACSTVLSDFPVPANLLGGTATVDVNGLPAVPLVYALAGNINYGDNYLFSVLEDRTIVPTKYACQTRKLRVFDFFYQGPQSGGELNTSASTPGGHEIFGGFKSTGIFRPGGTPIGQLHGSGNATQTNNIVLESGFWNIIN